jgi:beta-glucosidase
MNNNKFLWGVATSAFQIEGSIENDMTRWEREGKFRLDGKNPLYKNGVDHWNRWEEDFRLLKDLHVNAYRFSIEWARIEPESGKISVTALDRYDRMIDRLLDYDITPMLTLHHFSHPVWFHKLSPWHKKESVDTFARFAELVASRVKDRVGLFIIFNEPLVWLLAGYGDGKFPPGEKNIRKMMTALFNMLTAHRQAYDIIKSNDSSAEIGMAQNFIIFDAARKSSFLDKKLQDLVHYFYNLMIPEAFGSNCLRCHFPLLLHCNRDIPLDNKIDFWGINYYFRMHLRFKLNPFRPFQMLFDQRSSEGRSDLGWETYSTGIYRVMDWLRFTGKPFYITENGIATDDDERRLAFLRFHLGVVDWALKENFPLKGYFHWSFLDNYEWLEGYSARFGLLDVDHEKDMMRTIRRSGAEYAAHIRLNLK